MKTVYSLLIIAFTFTSCLTTESLSESSIKDDVTDNFKAYISACDSLHVASCIYGLQMESELLSLRAEFLSILRALEIVKFDEWDITWKSLLKDPVFIDYVDSGEQLVKTANYYKKLQVRQYFKNLGNGLSNISQSLSSSRYY